VIAGIGAAELRDLLERTLEQVDDDERIGPLLRASGLALRIECPDVDLVLNVAASDEPGRHLRWAFSDRGDWSPKLELRMNADVVHRYLQGRESLAIAIARGRVRCRGESHSAMLYVPAVRLMVEPYRRCVREHHPRLVLD
jgi:hypothetical protein